MRIRRSDIDSLVREIETRTKGSEGRSRRLETLRHVREIQERIKVSHGGLYWACLLFMGFPQVHVQRLHPAVTDNTVATRYGARLTGATTIALTLLDVLDTFLKIKICTGYRVGGQLLETVPVTRLLDVTLPVYEEWDGWCEPISEIRRFEDLPRQFLWRLFSGRTAGKNSETRTPRIWSGAFRRNIARETG